jgi:flagellar basal body-associated protein FliL
MAKKKKTKIIKDKEKKSIPPVLWIVAVVAVVITILAMSGNLPFKGTEEKGRSFQIREKETRPVLDPAMFTGQVRAAYAAAKKYPEIMNEVFCYCYCDEPPFNHKTLLSCFTEKHGAG